MMRRVKRKKKRKNKARNKRKKLGERRRVTQRKMSYF